ncbi:hypothetical protein NLX86_27505 [Streptomyces sp. A3M-1-3]|uniref:hypothetical protein n=1 Tax=Streptomyces sp. A3M-1-3 TaxID=2962044 RepID=UPI0020B7C244|nr:hypothetical protein [Streptomyces sp. A3M-1-3]MCP3821703.1 hypothetical protein [Streptomyces sp. A3M-1-3]
MATALRGKNLVRWLFAPAAEDVPRGHAAAAVFLRVLLLGLMWLYNVEWKRPPGFSGLTHFASFAVSHPVLPPFSWVVEHLVLPHIEVSAGQC